MESLGFFIDLILPADL